MSVTWWRECSMKIINKSKKEVLQTTCTWMQKIWTKSKMLTWNQHQLDQQSYLELFHLVYWSWDPCKKVHKIKNMKKKKLVFPCCVSEKKANTNKTFISVIFPRSSGRSPVRLQFLNILCSDITKHYDFSTSQKMQKFFMNWVLTSSRMSYYLDQVNLLQVHWGHWFSCTLKFNQNQ